MFSDIAGVFFVVVVFFSACHFQWQCEKCERAASQAGLCWRVWDLQLSAGEICTAESAGRREEGPVLRQGSMKGRAGKRRTDKAGCCDSASLTASPPNPHPPPRLRSV